MKSKLLSLVQNPNGKLMEGRSMTEALDLTMKQPMMPAGTKCQCKDETIDLLHQSKSLIEKLKVSELKCNSRAAFYFDSFPVGE